MNDERERYFDFSTDEQDVNAFHPGSSTGPELTQFADEIQKYLRHRNPVASIRGLLALHAATSAGVHIGARKSRTMTNSLLALIAVLLAYIAYAIS